MRAAAELPVHPAAGGAIDVDVAGTTLGPGAFLDAWNCFLADDGTLRRRPGLGSHHEAFDATGSALEGLGLARTEVLGLFQFDRVTDSRTTSTIYLAKVDDYLIGSRFGTRFDLRLARKLGQRSVADFTEVYSIAEHKRYVVLCTNDRGWMPSYWNGRLTPSVSAVYDVPAWGYFRTLVGAGYQEFAVFHNNRLFLAGGDPFQVIYSSAADFRDFANGGAFVMTPAFGRVTGFFKTFFGELIIGQERALSRVVEVAPGEFDGQVIVHKVGLMNNRCSDMMGNDQVFLSTDGQAYTLRTVQEFGDFQAAALSAPVYRSFREGAEHGRPYHWVHNDRENQIVWFGLATGNRVDRCYGYNYRHRQWVPALSNKALVGPSCAASWKLNRFNGEEKMVLGTYETNNFAATQKGRIFVFTPRHKEDHFLSSRSESNDANTPLHLLPKLRFPHPTQGGGAAGWPHQAQAVVAGSYVGSSSTWTTIQLRCTAVGGSGIIGGAGSTVTVAWEDVKGTHSGTLALGAAYTPGTVLSLTGTGITIAFNAPQTLPMAVGRELWILIDRGRRLTEVFAAALYDDIPLRVGLRKVAVDGTRPYKNFVSRAATPLLFAGDPNRYVSLRAITFITRVVGNRADNQMADETNPNYELNQSPFRNSLDVLLKCDEDPVWTQFALLDGNTAKQHHLDRSYGEVSGQFLGRPVRQMIIGASQADGSPLVDGLAVNIETVKIDRPCKTWRLMVGQFTAAANHWGGAASFNGFTGDFGLVGAIMHIEPIEDDGMNRMGEGSSSKTWEVGA